MQSRPLIKITRPTDYDFGSPVACLVDVHSQGIDSAWLIKRAASEEIRFTDYKPAPGHSLIHLIAMGDMESFGFNRNGDGFPKTACKIDLADPNWKEQRVQNGSVHVKSASTFSDHVDKGLIDCYKTFEKNAHVFRNHKNKPNRGDPIYGEIKVATFNHPMDRVELLIEVPNDKWQDDLQKLASGEDIPFSMASIVSKDYCSVCGHAAKSRAEYCDHLATQLTDLTKTGHVIGAINESPTFIDISRVNRPADRIAWSLMKAASAERPVGAAKLAEDYGLTFDPIYMLNNRDPRIAIRNSRRLNLLGKAAAIEKIVPATGRLVSIAKGVPQADHGKKVAVGAEKAANLITSLTERNVILNLNDFAHMILGQNAQVDSLVKSAQSGLEFLFNRIQSDPNYVIMNTSYDPSGIVDGLSEKVASDYGNSGFDSSSVQQRIIRNVVGGHRRNINESPVSMEKVSGFEAVCSREANMLQQEYASYLLSMFEALEKTAGMEVEQLIELTVAQNRVQ